jgi:hypothetical protein
LLLKIHTEGIKDFTLQLGPSQHSDFRQYLNLRRRGHVLPFFACLGSESSLKPHRFCLFIEYNFILLELSFEAQIGTNGGSVLPQKGNTFLEPPTFPPH